MNVAIVSILVGLSAIPALTFQHHLLIRAVQCLVSIACVLATGRRVRIAPTLSLFLVIVAMHLASPTGKVLLRVAGLPITFGALEIGLDKALLVVGLVFISRFSVRTGGVFAARRDSFVALVALYFERLTGQTRSRLKSLRSLSDLVGWIDELFLSIDVDEATGIQAAAPGERPVAPGWSLAFALFHWASFLIGRVSIFPDLDSLFLAAR